MYRITIKGRGKTFYPLLGFVGALVISLLLLLPFYGRMHFQRAEALLESGPYFAQGAAGELQKAVCLDPHNSEYHHQYGILLIKGFSRQREGIAQLQEAIRLSPWRHHYHFDLGMIYLTAGERKKGLEQIKKASQLYPLNADYHQWLRSIYLQIGEWGLASQEEQWIERIQRGDMD